MPPTTLYPFETSFAEIESNIDAFIDTVFSTLQSSFLLLPRGPGFVTYPEFQRAYEVLKRHSLGFTAVEPGNVMNALQENELAFLVLRTILGFTPPELAYITSQQSEVVVSQGFARNLDRQIRTKRHTLDFLTPESQKRVTAMISTACRLLKEHAAVEDTDPDMIHRLDKVDTRSGTAGLRYLATEGIPYAMLLYERFLGRPFAGHRDSVSGLVGEVMENAVEERLHRARISFRKTKRAERVEGFDQAPDFIVPDEWNPQVVVEAKITEDDGTARDKVTRIQHLAEISRSRGSGDRPGFQVIACIDGRGLGVRREDMRKLLEATQGKVFTLKTLGHLVENTALKAFRGE
jgi:hypothetical protein